MHVTLGTPVLGQMDPRVTLSFMRTVAHFGVKGIQWKWSVMMQNAVLAHARNTIVRDFLNSTSDRLLFIDADITFDPEDVFALLDRDEDVIGGLVSTKSPLKRHNATFIGPHETKTIDGTEKLHEALFIGTGFLSLSRKCLENLVKAMPELRYQDHPETPAAYALFDTGVVQGRYVGEDLMFCLRWRKIGGRIWVHTGLNLGHIGTHTYESKDLTP